MEVDRAVALFGVFVFVTIGWLAVSLVLGREKSKNWREGFSGAQTLLGTFALIIAGLWYFTERPDAPKLEMKIVGTPAGRIGDKVLLLVEVELHNIGSRVMNLGADDKFSIYIQQVTPLPVDVASELTTAAKSNPPQVTEGDNWEAIALVKPTLDTQIEANELETLYYRVLLQCQPDLRVYASVRLVKQRNIYDRFGIVTARMPVGALSTKQTLVDLSTICREAAGGH